MIEIVNHLHAIVEEDILRRLLTGEQWEKFLHDEKVTKMTLYTLNAPYREWQKSIAAIHGRGHTPVTTQSHP